MLPRPRTRCEPEQGLRAQNYSCNCSDATYTFTAWADNKKASRRRLLYSNWFLLDHQHLACAEIVAIQVVGLFQLSHRRVVGIRNAGERLPGLDLVAYGLLADRL